MLKDFSKKVAIMQPYTFPYIGYFQLLQAVDIFVFYDDVNFIKGGWINRNKIGNQNQLFTIPLHKASPNKKIQDIEIHHEKCNFWKKKFLKTIYYEYSQAQFFDDIYSQLVAFFNLSFENISVLAQSSVKLCCEYLGLEKEFYISSSLPVPPDISRSDRLIDITKYLNSNKYINSVGGKKLYEKSYFSDYGVSLQFLHPKLPTDLQLNSSGCHSYLSIIDVMMHNTKDDIKEMLDKYTLE